MILYKKNTFKKMWIPQLKSRSLTNYDKKMNKIMLFLTIHMIFNMKNAHKSTRIPQLIVSCLTNDDIEIKQNYFMSNNTYDIQYDNCTQKHMDTPPHRLMFN